MGPDDWNVSVSRTRPMPEESRPEEAPIYGETAVAGQVSRALCDLNRCIAELNDEVSRLHATIAPILTSRQDGPEPAPDPLPSEPSDLARDILDQVERLTTLARFVRSITERVDL